jgi:hypothetical protein
MSVDMLAFCLDHPAPATIILASGDRDFAYAMSVLRHRQYRMVLVAPAQPTAHVTLRAQASLVLDWTNDVLGQATRGDSSHALSTTRASGASVASRIELQTSSPSITSTSWEKATPPGTCLPGPPLASHSIGNVRTAPQSNEHFSETSLESQSDINGAPVNPCVKLLRLGGRLRQSSFPAYPPPSEGLEQPTFTTGGSSRPRTMAQETSLQGNTTLSLRPVSTSTPALDDGSMWSIPTVKFQPLIDKLVHHLETGWATPLRSVVASQLNGKIYEKAGVCTFGEYIALAQKSGIVQLGGVGGNLWISLVQSTSTWQETQSQHPGVSTALYPNSRSSSTQPHGGLMSDSPSSLSSVLDAHSSTLTSHGSRPTGLAHAEDVCASSRFSSWAPSNTASVKPPVSSPRFASTSQDCGTRAPSGLPLPSCAAVATPAASTASRLHPPAVQPNVIPLAGSSLPNTSTPERISAIPSPVAQFLPLIVILRKLRLHGLSQISRRDLRVELYKHDKEVFVKAGVTKIRTYLASAKNVGIVETEGKGQNQWVSLAPAWTGVFPSLASPVEFQPLITVLQEFRLAGVMRPSRSVVAAGLLGQNKDVYAQVGVVDFGEYVDLAVSAGIVKIGRDSLAWISFAPEWLRQQGSI